MELDLRLTTLDRLDEALALPASAISVGHEGCPHKLPGVEDLQRAAERIRGSGKSFTFVVPISYERFIAEVAERVVALARTGPIIVVANDLGMLAELADRGLPGTCTLAAGHGLSYSFEQQPWIDLSLDREAPAIREAFCRNSLDDPQLWPELRKWGVSMIEVDGLPRTSASFTSLRAAGFDLNVLLDVVPVAYARSCHTARYYGIAPPECVHHCDRPFELTATDRWRLVHGNLELISKQARAEIPDFTVFGNVVYRRTEGWQPGPDTPAARVTLDVRYYTTQDLPSRISRLPGYQAA